MSRPRILTVLGTRPELVKLSPLIPLLDGALEQVLLHTGQHYSAEMDAVFFADLGLRPPDLTLRVGSGRHGEQTGAILAGVERALLADRPYQALLCLGDTNSTLGGALAAAKLAVPVIHVEAGCRSGRRHMPEEINRVLVDQLADLLLCPDEAAAAHLGREGIDGARVRVVGSTSIDAALQHGPRAAGRPIVAAELARLGLGAAAGREALLCTVHRAENTTDEVLPGLLRGLGRIAERYPILLPLHPRTQKVVERLGLPWPARVRPLPPLGYLDLLALLGSVRALLTDSGGLQEEAAALRTPALVLRDETEWTYLIEAGANALVGNDERTLPERALALLADAPNGRMRDAASSRVRGDAAPRIARAVGDFLRCGG